MSGDIERIRSEKKASTPGGRGKKPSPPGGREKKQVHQEGPQEKEERKDGDFTTNGGTGIEAASFCISDGNTSSSSSRKTKGPAKGSANDDYIHNDVVNKFSDTLKTSQEDCSSCEV